MKQNLQILLLKLKVSTIAMLRVMRHPKYFAISIIVIFISANLIIWSLNLELAQYILREQSLNIADKLYFFSSSVRDIFTTYESTQALGIAIFSVLFGINIALFSYVLSNIGLKDMAKKSGTSGAGLVFAVISGGCVACGTSLLTPIAVTFGATSGAFLRDISLLLNLVSSILIIFSLYKLGLLAATLQVKNSFVNKLTK